MRGWKIRRRDSRAEETGRNGGGGEGGAYIPVQAGKSAHVLCSCWARFFTATLKSRFK